MKLENLFDALDSMINVDANTKLVFVNCHDDTTVGKVRLLSLIEKLGLVVTLIRGVTSSKRTRLKFM